MRSRLQPKRFFVIIPCYNCEEYIEECLNSLKNQSFKNWSALVADDASTDGTADVVRQYIKQDSRIKLRTGNTRAWLMGNTLNALRSLPLQPSDVVTILDGDDTIKTTCLEEIWKAHSAGYDLVYTDEEIEGQPHSIGSRLLQTVPVRKQLWCFSQLRSFKAYLFALLEDQTFRDELGRYFRAAGDLSLYLPIAELAGMDKVHFIPEKLYYYRVHDHCNFKVMRQEQLDNNWFIRSRSALYRQTRHFDFEETVHELKKDDLNALGKTIRAKYPLPYSVQVSHVIAPDERDSWRAYHDLWIEEGIFLTEECKE